MHLLKNIVLSPLLSREIMDRPTSGRIWASFLISNANHARSLLRHWTLLFTIQKPRNQEDLPRGLHLESRCIQIVKEKAAQNTCSPSGSAVSDHSIVYSYCREQIARCGSKECLRKQGKLVQRDGLLTNSHSRSFCNNFEDYSPRDAVQDPSIQRRSDNVPLRINKKHRKGRSFQNRLLVRRKNK